MSVDIKRLLRKRGWSGREVGQALLLSLTDSYVQATQGNPNPEPLFTQAQFTRMTQSITDPVEGAIYNRHIGVNNWLMQYQAVANAHLQQLQGNINALVTSIATSAAAEEEILLYGKLPVIMTQQQYDDLVAKRIEEQFKSEDGEELRDTITQMVFSVIGRLATELSTNPKGTNPLKAVRKKYLQEKVTDPRILNAYNKAYDRGYYLFPDGRRSDQMSEDEWIDAAITPELVQKLRDMEESGELTDPTHGMGDSPSSWAVKNLSRKENISRYIRTEGADFSFFPFSWRLYEEPPEDLCKWDILEDVHETQDYYPALFYEEGTTDADYLEDLIAFKKEFPEAVDVALKVIDKCVGEPVSQIPVEEWGSVMYSWRDLYELDFPGMRSLLEDAHSIFNGNYRALANGVAILQPNTSPLYRKDHILDKQGFYIEPTVGTRLSTALGLGRFTPANADYVEALEEIETRRSRIESDIYWLKGYDFIIERLAEILDIQNFTVFKIGLQPCLDRLEALNGMVKALAKQIRGTIHPSEEAKETKLQVLQDVFYHFKGSEIEPPEDVKDQVKEALSDLKIFDRNDGQLMLFFTPPEREED